MKKLLLGTFVLLAGAAAVLPAQAAVLTGDDATITFQPDNLVLGPFTVGAGTDFTLLLFTFDLDAGAGANEFVFNDNSGTFAGNSSIVLSDLDFSGGENLVGFSLLATSLSNLTFSFTNNSLTFLFDSLEGGPNNGPAIHGQFITRAVAPVPLPAALPLLAAGVSAMGFMGWRKRRRAA